MIEPRPELSKLSDYVPGKSIEEIRERYGLEKVVKLASKPATVANRASRSPQAPSSTRWSRMPRLGAWSMTHVIRRPMTRATS